LLGKHIPNIDNYSTSIAFIKGFNNHVSAAMDLGQRRNHGYQFLKDKMTTETPEGGDLY
jgi:hypothetical protein